MADKKLGLDDAYAVETPDDNRALYRDWAESYESDFTVAHGYVYHEGVVALFVERAQAVGLAANARILDVGCGTGVVAVALGNQGFENVDGMDISPEMLQQAEAKQIYGALIEADLTKPLDLATGSYQAVVSVGTFTHGHLGPEPLRELARIAAPGALFAIGINAEHYEARGFQSLLQSMEQEGAISGLALATVPMYQGDGAAEHADDLAQVAIYQRM